MKDVVPPKQAIPEIRSGQLEASRRRYVGSFYIMAGLFMIVLSVIGFGPSIIDQSTRNAPSTLLVMAHGFVIGGWLLLFLTQAILVATGRTDVHRRLGTVAPAFAFLLIVLGYFVLIDFGRRGYDFSGDVVRAIYRRSTARFNPAVILFPLSELLTFGVLVGAGLRYRHRPEIHKRLMLFALVPFSVEPILHLVGHLAGRWQTLRGMGTPISAAATLLLLSSCAIHDRLSPRRVAPVSLWIPVLLFSWQIVLASVIFPSDLWRSTVAWLVR